MSSSLCPRVHDGHSELDGATLPRRYQQQHGALRLSLSHLCESPEVPSTTSAWRGGHCLICLPRAPYAAQHLCSWPG